MTLEEGRAATEVRVDDVRETAPLAASLAALLGGSPYLGYEYAYPHKTAYRPLAPARALAEVWGAERRDALFLYLHVPFCEMRCGFCNLFTSVNPRQSFIDDYLDALERQARAVRAQLGVVRWARAAIGGGTPTYLDERQLARLIAVASELMGAELTALPTSVEVSPETVTPGKLALLAAAGVDRVSIGVQSFSPEETREVGRPQPREVLTRALELLRAAPFSTLNIDLIYGLPSQTEASWEASLAAALAYAPEEVYLYPLYVRPLTGLGRSERAWDDQRLRLYRAGRERLLAAGYVQSGMRMFRRADAGNVAGPVYCVQEDGMVGLGCGARSYTAALHYASDWAVSARGVKEILAAWVRRDDAAFAVADYGLALDGDEQRRRHVVLPLLADGLDVDGYRRRFGAEPEHDLPQLGELVRHGLALRTPAALTLTAAGLERSDLIGPWLRSPAVRARMQGFALR